MGELTRTIEARWRRLKQLIAEYEEKQKEHVDRMTARAKRRYAKMSRADKDKRNNQMKEKREQCRTKNVQKCRTKNEK